MTGRFKKEATALQTGLKHGAMGAVILAATGGIVSGSIATFGDDKAAGPSVDLNLFAEHNGASPVLKSRIDDGLTTSDSFSSGSYGGSYTNEEPEPTLPVAMPGGAANSVKVQNSDYPVSNDKAETAGTEKQSGVRIITDPSIDAETSSNGPTRINVAEQLKAAGQPVIEEAKMAGRAPLPAAPISGLYENGPVGRLPKISESGLKPSEAYARPHTSTSKPKISLVVGGLGLKYSLTMQAIRDLPPEVTLSFVPYSNRLQTYIDAARAAGHEVLLELPMEPYDYPNVDTGPETLLTSVSNEENIRRLNILLGKATGYFGVINYQGAKMATDSQTLQPIVEELSDRGLAFIYDGSAPRSVFKSVSETNNIEFVQADRIVDVRRTPEAIDRNLLHLEALSLQNGHALGVGFSYPVTVDQFQQWTETLKFRDYELAPVSLAAGVKAKSSSNDG